MIKISYAGIKRKEKREPGMGRNARRRKNPAESELNAAKPKSFRDKTGS